MPLLADIGLQFKRAEMQMVRWMCGVFHKKTVRQLLVEVEHVTPFIRTGILRWCGHVMKKSDEDWVKKSMAFRVEDRRPVGRPRMTRFESVEANMA